LGEYQIWESKLDCSVSQTLISFQYTLVMEIVPIGYENRRRERTQGLGIKQPAKIRSDLRKIGGRHGLRPDLETRSIQ
jgi:hypothetical protein